ncbi:endonuclease V isoform X7 [Apodemus sylvaticus]|uniref:endonuclease V isoform X7 n=1 Tax=Apodemus sylvaticus TaxID=10129 RepID=UPI0022422355|nr:endonuclease V isoform X7 [Apodemus sylvaticus]
MAHTAAEWPPEETLSLWKGEQARLKARVVQRDTEAWQRDPSFSGLQKVGGVDVSFVKGDNVRACASLVVLSYPELKEPQSQGSRVPLALTVLPPAGFSDPHALGAGAVLQVVYEDSRMVGLKAPYVSGFLAFREVPFLVELVQQLQEKEPDIMPQIVLLQAGGDTFPLIGNSGTVLGMALKSHDHSTKPLYVSVGHRISLEVAVRLTHHCCRFRIPEPIRQADIRSREYIRRTLGHPGGSPAQRKDRSQKEQRPNTCPHGGPGAPADPGRPPEGSSTDPKNPEPGVWEKEDQQSEGPGRQEDSALWPPSPAWVQSPP